MFTRFILHLFTLLRSPQKYFQLILIYKIVAHDFSRVTFATEVFTNTSL